MSSHSGPPITAKNACSPAQTTSPSQIQSSSSSATESHSQRRAGGSGSFGAGSCSRSTSASARNHQLLRRQHKSHRRPKLMNEDADDEAQSAMQSSGSRKGKTSITHLMNFALPPRPQAQHYHHHGRTTRKNPSWGLGSGYHAADKARYIHANYRFIVSPNGDYRAQARDADVHLDWSNVLQILVSAQSQSTNCPICLSTPTVPRMAKCGHLFCMSCLIRYMHSEEINHPPEKKARWKKCPICWDCIYISETRPVRWFTGQEAEPPQEGGDAVLRLLTHQPNSTLAIPRDAAEIGSADDEIPWFFVAEVMDYARILKGSGDYMMLQYDQEIAQLLDLERHDELMFGDDTQWTRKAVASVNEAKEKVKDLGNPPSSPRQPSDRKSRKAPLEHNSGQIQGEMLSGASDLGTRPLHGESSTIDQLSVARPSHDQSSMASVMAGAGTSESSQRNLRDARGSSSASRCALRETPFYFYESLLHYYLSPLDIRILKAAFGEYSSFPSTILPRVEHISTGHIVDDELRRRAKYLAHLPQGCEVAFLECNWTDVVPSHILDAFAGEISRRRKRNQDKEMREEKERMRAEKAEDDLRWAAARRKRETFTEDNPTELDLQSFPENGFSSTGAESSSPPWSSARAMGGSGFAPLASPSTSPAIAKTVWGTRIAAPHSPTLTAEANRNDTPESDGWLHNWEHDALDEDELLTQVQEMSMEAGGSSQQTRLAGNKKKKGKKITLMTTNARRGA